MRASIGGPEQLENSAKFVGNQDKDSLIENFFCVIYIYIWRLKDEIQEYRVLRLPVFDIPTNTVTICGGVVFLLFAFASLVQGPGE